MSLWPGLFQWLAKNIIQLESSCALTYLWTVWGAKNKLSHCSSVCFLLLQISQAKCIYGEMRNNYWEMKTLFKKHTRRHTSLKTVILGENEFQGLCLCFKHLRKPLLTLGSRCTHRCHHFSLGICLWECLSSLETVSSLTVRTEIVHSAPVPGVWQNTWQHSRYSVFTEWITHIFFCILSVLTKFHSLPVDLPFGNS